MAGDKASLLLQLQQDWRKYWDLKVLRELGYKRMQCSNCKKWFWSISEQDVCNDASCRPYEFIDNPLMPKKWDYFTAWKAIQKFFVKEGHTPLERYPVIARWFPNLYFTIAGIVDFYRMKNSKFVFEFPKNVHSAILLQPSLRFVDIPEVGISGRHWTTHGHIEQASLYDPVKKTGYWKERCIELDYRLLTEVFGVKPDRINWLEDAWLGAGAFGYSLEYHLAGIELGNAVFTEFEGTPDNYRVMPKKVIDMGAGLERFVWASQRTPTSYEAVLGPVISKMISKGGIKYDKEFFARYSKLAGKLNLDDVKSLEETKAGIARSLGVDVAVLNEKIEPLQAVFAVADHAKTLLFAAADGGIPSNVGGGYNLRVVLRKAMGFIDKYRLGFDLVWAGEHIARFYKPLHPELLENMERFKEIISVEEKRYRAGAERARKSIEVILDNGEPVTEEKMMDLYDSQGITPELFSEVAARKGINIEIPSGLYAKVAAKHEKERAAKESWEVSVESVAPTEALYHSDENESKFGAKVLKVEQNKFVVLDKTAFYPRGGGQEPDLGFIGGFRVFDVEKVGNVVVHAVDNPKFKAGDSVKCEVDWGRRSQITIHHDATHIINQAARQVVGPWIWQAGSKKDADKAHIDMTHYDSLTPEQVKKIEDLANKIAKSGLKIRKEVMERQDAEKKYGFIIYQGAAVPSEELRIVSIGTFDTEACGGTHGNNSRDVYPIIITKHERPADGTIRLVYKAGPAAESYLKEAEKSLEKCARLLKVKEKDMPKAVENLFDKWKKTKKQLEELKKGIAETKIEKLTFEPFYDIRVLVSEVYGDANTIQKMSLKLSEDDTVIVLFGIEKDKIDVFASAGELPMKKQIGVGEVVREVCEKLGGAGGGNPVLARGTVPISSLSRLDTELVAIKNKLKKMYKS